MTHRDIPLLGLSARIPPSNHQAEQALLGALMANNLACRHVDFLRGEHFADPVHGVLFDAITRHYRSGRVVDAITLRAEFGHSGVLNEVGGTAYLSQLLTAMVGIINAGEYGRAIHDAWLRRQLIDIGEEIVNRALGADPEMVGLCQVQSALHRLATVSNEAPLVLLGVPEIKHLRDFHQALVSHLEGLRPKPHGMISVHERRAAMLHDLLPEADQAGAFTEGEMVAGKAVDMREPSNRPVVHDDDLIPIYEDSTGETIGYRQVRANRQDIAP